MPGVASRAKVYDTGPPIHDGGFRARSWGVGYAGSKRFESCGFRSSSLGSRSVRIILGSFFFYSDHIRIILVKVRIGSNHSILGSNHFEHFVSDHVGSFGSLYLF